MNGSGLKKARKRLKQSQEELAALLGTTQSKISRLERMPAGNVKPRYSKVVRALLRQQLAGASSELVEYRPVVPVPEGMPRRVLLDMIAPPTKGKKPAPPSLVMGAEPDGEAEERETPSEPPPEDEPGERGQMLTRWARRHWGKAASGLALASAIGCLSSPERIGRCPQEKPAPALHVSTDAGKTSTPRASARDGGVAWSSWTGVPVMSGRPRPDVISEPVPPIPAVNQERAPCEGLLLKRIMVVINGGCWIKVDLRPPCVDGYFEHQGACYIPALKMDAPPRSQTKGKSGVVIPTAG